MTDPYDLKSLPTKVLLQYLQAAREKRGRYYPVPGGHAISNDDIKAELKKREHVPNKQEARVVRRERAYRDQARRNRRKSQKKRRGW